MPANAATTTVIAINAPVAPFALPAAAAINANIPMSIPIAMVDPTNLSGSMYDKTTTAAAIMAIATVIATMLPTHFLASFVAAINKDIIIPKIDTAAIPFSRFSSGTRPNITATTAKSAIAPDIIKIV